MKRKQAINLQIFAVSEVNIVIVVQAVELKLFIWQPVTTSNFVPCLLAANSSDHTMQQTSIDDTPCKNPDCKTQITDKKNFNLMYFINIFINRQCFFVI